MYMQYEVYNIWSTYTIHVYLIKKDFGKERDSSLTTKLLSTSYM